MSTLVVDSIENLAGDERFGPILMTETAFGGATSVDFTGIPSWVKKVTVMGQNIDTSGTASVVVRVGNGTDGVVSTGYTRQYAYISDAAAADADAQPDFTSGLRFGDGGSPISFIVEFFRMDSGGLKWIAQGTGSINAVNDQLNFLSGIVTMSYALDRIRVTTTNGTDTATGNVNVMYE